MRIDVKHVAKLANLPLSEDEEKKLETQLQETLDYVQNLNEVDTTDTPPTDHVNKLENVLREDAVSDSLSQENALKNAKTTEKGMFKVPAVLEQ